MVDSTIRHRTMAKVTRRLIPIMIAMFCANFIDRVNISFAALQMNRDLNLTPEIYGFAAGILFISYTACEIPSNLILARVGARIWLARIMVTWGLIAAANALVTDRYSLYGMRFLLGAAEAGFFPGLMVYLSAWFPANERGRAVTLFMLGNPISVIFGAPLSTAILSMDGLWGIAGWQYLMVFEGLPAVILGVVAYFYLTDTPADATWLHPDEREWLANTIAAENRVVAGRGPRGVAAVFVHGPTLMLAASKFCVLLSFFGITLWLPQIVRGFGNLTNFEIGCITALPYIGSAIGSVAVGRSSDKRGERAWHIAIPSLIGALGFLAATLTGNPYVAMAGLCVAATGLWICNTVVWALPPSILTGAAAAAGFAYINTIGNLGGFFGPYFTGWIRATTGSFSLALAMMGGFLALSGLLVVIIEKQRVRRQLAFAAGGAGK